MDETTKAAMESGRPLTIFNIHEVHQLNPNATHITNNYYDDFFINLWNRGWIICV